MSEGFYETVRRIGRVVFRIASKPRLLHEERAARPGAYLLAANHVSPFDAPLLIAATPRVIYWLSIVEIFRHPLAGWFLRSIGAEPLDRGKVDTRTLRRVVRNLRTGRVVGIFPEGALRSGATSVLAEGGIHEGVCKLAQLASVPVLPCVVLGGEKFGNWKSWLPGARTRWAVAYGEAIFPGKDPDPDVDRKGMAQAITDALRALHTEVALHV
jgi:1-acyl-sn-glycerol-3-phosphate acyltransferase